MIRTLRYPAVPSLALAWLCLWPSAGISQLTDSARARLSQIEGELRIAGLDSAVEVRRDRWGVPHIYARTQHDLFFAQGLVAAQDRLWQIDMWRRIGEGRLSEVLGPRFAARDRFARLLKYRGDMAAEWASYAPDTREIVTAFVAGLNAWVRTVRDRPPIEYDLLGFRPEPFADDVPLQRMAALSMTGNATLEVARAQLVVKLGAEKAAELWPPDPYRPFDPAPGLDLSVITDSSLGATRESYGGVRYPRLDGSNNWVVSGALTASGRPLLANDPHRTIATPSLRYVTHLVGPGWNVIGAGEPAVPGVAGGHNERIAFGFTIVGMDQQDVYVEEVGPCPSDRRHRCYRHDDTWEPIQTIIDTIPVKGEAARVVRLEFTSHGPIVAEDSAAGRAFVIRFVGSEPGTAGYLAQISINRATDWDSFKAAAFRWRLPTENLVYADVDGNIGWIAAGLMPIRSWSGMLPVPGDGRYEWTGFLPFEELPVSLNPPTGFIATANHNILPPGYDQPLNYEWASPYRYNRLVEALGSRAGWTREDFQRLQHDEVSLPARELVPLLLAAADRQVPAHPGVLALFRTWDHTMEKDGSAPVAFAAWVDTLMSRYYRARAGDDGLALLEVDGPDLPAMIRALRAPDASFGADPAAGRDRLLVESFDAAAAAAKSRFGDEPAAWRYGTVHLARFRHPLAQAFDLPDASRGGDGWTVNVTGGPDFRQSSGASWREVIDLADWDNSVATSVPGQSGQPGSPFYGNLLPLWEKGAYFPLAFSRKAVERETAHVLWLRPGT